MLLRRLKKKNSPPKSAIREWFSAILWALALAFIIRASVVQANVIPSGSMEPTLLIGDNLLVNRLAYDLKVPFTDHIIAPLGQPERGDIVVFANPEGSGPDFIKRIIGLPGETLSIKGGVIHINGRPLERDWGYFIGGSFHLGRNFGPVTVPPRSYFVMGDNRDNSHDSRFWNQERGRFVPRREIRGKAMVVHWSYKDAPWSLRWERFGTVLQ